MCIFFFDVAGGVHGGLFRHPSSPDLRSLRARAVGPIGQQKGPRVAARFPGTLEEVDPKCSLTICFACASIVGQGESRMAGPAVCMPPPFGTPSMGIVPIRLRGGRKPKSELKDIGKVCCLQSDGFDRVFSNGQGYSSGALHMCDPCNARWGTRAADAMGTGISMRSGIGEVLIRAESETDVALTYLFASCCSHPVPRKGEQETLRN